MKRNKIVLIGSGHVGSSFAYALVSHGSADELAIIDIDTEKAEADVWDLNHTTLSVTNPSTFILVIIVTVKMQILSLSVRAHLYQKGNTSQIIRG